MDFFELSPKRGQGAATLTQARFAAKNYLMKMGATNFTA